MPDYEPLPIDDPTVENAGTFTLFSDSKLRRETSNFKINISASMGAIESNPVLVKQLDPGMKREEFLGLAINVDSSGSSMPPCSFIVFYVSSIPDGDGYALMNLGPAGLMPMLYYNPANGKLSIGGVIGDNDTTAKDIRIKMRANTGDETVTVDSIESGLSPEDFIDVPVEMYKDGQLYMTERIASAVLFPNDAILLTIGTEEPLRLTYNPSTGELVLRRQSGSSSL